MTTGLALVFCSSILLSLSYQLSMDPPHLALIIFLSVCNLSLAVFKSLVRFDSVIHKVGLTGVPLLAQILKLSQVPFVDASSPLLGHYLPLF